MKLFLIVLLAASAYAAPRLLNPKIIGGNDADDGEYPYQVSLRLLNQHSCGGSILTPKTILTAAHCSLGFIPILSTVVVGSNSIWEGGESYQPSKMVIHPEFDLLTIVNDIAVVHLTSEIVYNDKVQPISFGTDFIGANVDCVLTGWGLTKYPGLLPPPNLKEINLRTVSNDDCGQLLEYTGLTINDHQICTLTQEGEGACQGDSGGPLVIEGSQIGVVSWENRVVQEYPTSTPECRLLLNGSTKTPFKEI